MKKWWDDLVRDFRDLWAELTKPSESEAWLRKYMPLPAEREEVNALGIEAVKLGLTSDQLAPMARIFYIADSLNVTRDDIVALAQARLTPAERAESEEFRRTMFGD